MTIIELKNVNYQVGKRTILNNLSFGIKNGDFLTLIGPREREKYNSKINCELNQSQLMEKLSQVQAI